MKQMPALRIVKKLQLSHAMKKGKRPRKLWTGLLLLILISWRIFGVQIVPRSTTIETQEKGMHRVSNSCAKNLMLLSKVRASYQV